jgi:hypothetical protein
MPPDDVIVDTPQGSTPDPSVQGEQDPVLAAMAALDVALRRFSDHTVELLEACDRTAGMRKTGASYRELADKGCPFIGEGTGPLRDLLDAVGEYRRCHAKALYEEGLTMAQLGRLLGVSRQRVAVLLDEKKGEAAAKDESEG